MASESVPTLSLDSSIGSSLQANLSDYRDESPLEESSSSLTVKKKEKKKRLKDSLAPFSHIFTTSNKKKNAAIHKIFSSLPESEKLIDDFSCALQRDVLIHGRLYLTQNWLCFYANIFSFETVLTIPFHQVRTITKEKTARIIPNAIRITTDDEKYGFTSLLHRDTVHAIIVKVWDNSSLPEPLSPMELLQAIKEIPGDSKDAGSEDTPVHKKKKGKKHKQASVEDHSDSSVTALVRNANTLWLEGKGDVGAVPSPSSDTTAQASGGDLDAPSAISVPHPSGGGDSMVSGDSDSDEQEEVPCGCSEHYDKTPLSEVYNTDVETVYQLIFSDSDFIRSVFKARKAVSLEIEDWQSQSDGTKTRDAKYTLELNLSFGPKFSNSTEHSVCKWQPNLKYIIDYEIVTSNVPYSDSFSMLCRCCVTRVSANKTRVHVSAKVNFKKSCWGLIKNIIEKNSTEGIMSHYKTLDTHLKEYLAAKQRAARRKSSVARAALAPSLSPTGKPPSSPPPSTPDLIPHGRPSITVAGAEAEASAEKKQGSSYHLPRVRIALALLLGVLIVSNMVLYRQLMSYQGSDLPFQATSLPTAAQTPQERAEWLTLKTEWIGLVRQQFEGHDRERQNWYKTLSGLVEALEQIEATVGTAKKLLVAQLETQNPTLVSEKEPKTEAAEESVKKVWSGEQEASSPQTKQGQKEL